MQYVTLVLAALNAAAALPGARKSHHHHRRHAEAGLADVNWAQALADIDWATVKYQDSVATTEVVNVVGTTTVAVAVAAAAAATTLSTSALAAGNVVKAQATIAPTTSAAAVAAAAPVAASSTSKTTAAAVATAASVASTSSGDHYSIEVINNCAYTIWQAGWQTNTAGGIISSAVKGNEMTAGSSISLSIPKTAMGVQIWPRTGCTGSGSSFHCSVGDCQGFECSSIIWQDGPIMAEFGSGLNTDMYNTGITAYDISVIPGNNCGAKIVPSISSCETKYCPLSGCSTSQAWQSAGDIALGSPADTTCSDSTNFTVTFCPA